MVPEESDKKKKHFDSSISKQFFITEAGKGSRSHDLSADFRVNSLIVK